MAPDRKFQPLGEVETRLADRDNRPSILEELLEFRIRGLSSHTPELRLIFSGNVLGHRSATATTAATTASPAGRGQGTVDEDQRRILRVEIAGVELRSEYAIEGILELLENPPCPAGVHRAPVLIPQSNSGRTESPRTLRFGVARDEGEAQAIEQLRTRRDRTTYVEVTVGHFANVGR